MMKKRKTNSLYIHIPFCSHICSYCDFTKLIYNEKFASNYLRSVFLELDSYCIDKVMTIYIGGGTPTSLNDKDFESLLRKASSYLDKDYEFTVEANIESLTINKLLLMKKYGVNRLSIGVEATDELTLKIFNRHHSFIDAKKCVEMAKNVGFNNINVDLIYGFKTQTKDVLIKNLNDILLLDCPHISIYSLTIHQGTQMYNNGEEEQNQDDSREYYDLILSTLREHGYHRYEVSNFAKLGYESKHNQVYWRNEEYYGIGLGASGYVNGVRYVNTKNLTEYCKGNFIKETETVTDLDFLEYYLMLNLRMEHGFLREDFNNLFGYDFYVNNKDKCDQLIKDGLLLVDDYIYLTDEGLITMDRILLKLL